MIDDIVEETGCGIRLACGMLDIPRSTYYSAAIPTLTRLKDGEIGDLVEEIFHAHRARYGYRRIHQELAARDVVCAECRVRRIMRERGLVAIQHRGFKPQTSDGRADAPSPNLIARDGLPTGPDRAWAGDITYIRTAGGWLYLAVVIDLYTRRAIGWAIADNMRADLVVAALDQAIGSRPGVGDGGRIFHSDRGSQYGSRKFRELLAGAGITQSMSGRANPYDNAWSESFIGTIKREFIGDGEFEGMADAKPAIFEYLEGYYNTRRLHSSLGYKTPAAFEAAHAQTCNTTTRKKKLTQ